MTLLFHFLIAVAVMCAAAAMCVLMVSGYVLVMTPRKAWRVWLLTAVLMLAGCGAAYLATLIR